MREVGVFEKSVVFLQGSYLCEQVSSRISFTTWKSKGRIFFFFWNEVRVKKASVCKCLVEGWRARTKLRPQVFGFTAVWVYYFIPCDFFFFESLNVFVQVQHSKHKKSQTYSLLHCPPQRNLVSHYMVCYYSTKMCVFQCVVAVSSVCFYLFIICLSVCASSSLCLSSSLYPNSLSFCLSICVSV